MSRPRSTPPGSLTAARGHGKTCPCMFCKLIEQGWVLIAPDGSVWCK